MSAQAIKSSCQKTSNYHLRILQDIQEEHDIGFSKYKTYTKFVVAAWLTAKHPKILDASIMLD